jgi:hypothetical protein
MTGESVRLRAAEETAFIHELARMVFELRETEAIVESWRAGVQRLTETSELDEQGRVSLLVALLEESRRMAVTNVAGTVRDMSSVLEKIKEGLEDGYQDDQQQLQFELQDAMDEYQKAQELLSNILKKIDCTANAIIQNLK